MRLQRLLLIIFYLKKHHGLTLEKLSQYLEVSRRTISRDIDMLKTAGVQIESKSGKNGGYFLAEDFSFDRIIFNESELRFMLLATKFLHQFENTEFATEAKLLYDKISKMIGKNKDENIKSEEFLPIDTNNDLSSHINKALKNIEEAYKSQKLLYIAYNNLLCNRFSTSGFVAPYGLVNKLGYWYLIGYCYEHMTCRVFNITFIKDIYITDNAFERDKLFHLDTFWENKTINNVDMR